MHPDGSGWILIGLDGLIDLNEPLRVWMDPDFYGWNLISLDGSTFLGISKCVKIANTCLEYE